MKLSEYQRSRSFFDLAQRFDTRSGNILSFHLPLFQEGQLSVYWRKYVHEVLVNRLGGLSLPRKSVVRLTDRPDMTLDVYRGRKTTIQHSDFKVKTCFSQKQSGHLEPKFI